MKVVGGTERGDETVKRQFSVRHRARLQLLTEADAERRRALIEQEERVAENVGENVLTLFRQVRDHAMSHGGLDTGFKLSGKAVWDLLTGGEPLPERERPLLRSDRVGKAAWHGESRVQRRWRRLNAARALNPSFAPDWTDPAAVDRALDELDV